MRKARLGALLLVTFLVGEAAWAGDDRIPLAAGDTYRAPAAPTRTRDTFSIDVEKPGLLTLDVSLPHLLETHPAGEVVASRPGSLALWFAEPVVLELQVSSSVPGEPLGAYKLRSAFVEQATPEMGQLPLAEDPPNTCTVVPTSLGQPFNRSQGVLASNVVDEWDCDVLEGQTLTAGVLRLESRLGALQTALFGGSVCGSETLLGAGTLVGLGQILAPIFPGPFRIAVEAAQGFAGAYVLGAALLDPCHQGEQDDHHETWLCATPLAENLVTEGTIGNQKGDDVDQLSFTLTESREVLLDLGNPVAGWRLRVTNAAGTTVAGTLGTDWWRARLGAGRYFLAIDRPDGSSASYHLTWSTYP